MPTVSGQLTVTQRLLEQSFTKYSVELFCICSFCVWQTWTEEPLFPNEAVLDHCIYYVDRDQKPDFKKSVLEFVDLVFSTV